MSYLNINKNQEIHEETVFFKRRKNIKYKS